MVDRAGDLTAAVSRRQLLVGTFGAAVASRLTAWSPRGTSSVADLTLARFRRHVGEKFGVRLGPFRWLGLTLVEATGADEAFSVVFASAAPKRFESGTLVVDHPAVGAVPLFLVAVDRGRKGQLYQAVFDRRVSSGTGRSLRGR